MGVVEPIPDVAQYIYKGLNPIKYGNIVPYFRTITPSPSNPPVLNYQKYADRIVKFWNGSLNSGYQYTWNLGDNSAPVNESGPKPLGNYIEAIPFYHQYAEIGTYHISLNERYGNKVSLTSKAILTITDDPIILSFNAVAVGSKKVYLINTSNVYGTSFIWDFGDGTSYAGNEKLAYTYAADGTYDVTLTITNILGISYPVTISVNTVPSVGEWIDVDFEDLVEVSQIWGSTSISSYPHYGGGDSWGGYGGVSVETIDSAIVGAGVQFQMVTGPDASGKSSPAVAVGLSHGTEAYSYDTVDFCVLAFDNDTDGTKIYENGVLKHDCGMTYRTFQLLINSLGKIEYYGTTEYGDPPYDDFTWTLLYTSLNIPSFPLKFVCYVETYEGS